MPERNEPSQDRDTSERWTEAELDLLSQIAAEDVDAAQAVWELMGEDDGFDDLPDEELADDEDV